MSDFHRAAHAEACAAKSLDQPPLAADCEAEMADCSGVVDVSAVSTPTNFVNSYDVPLRAAKVTLWLALRFFALLVEVLEVGVTAVLSVDATAPALPVAVWNATSTVGAPLTEPPPVWLIRRAPAPSMRSVTVALPLHRGVTVRRTAPTCGLLRAAITS